MQTAVCISKHALEVHKLYMPLIKVIVLNRWMVVKNKFQADYIRVPNHGPVQSVI